MYKEDQKQKVERLINTFEFQIRRRRERIAKAEELKLSQATVALYKCEIETLTFVIELVKQILLDIKPEVKK